MSVTFIPKGPALLAQAGVTLADAKWLFSQIRSGDGSHQQDPRFGAIHAKVSNFVGSQTHS